MDFVWLGNQALIVDSRSALVAYLKCHYFMSHCSWCTRNLEGIRFNNDSGYFSWSSQDLIAKIVLSMEYLTHIM